MLDNYLLQELVAFSRTGTLAKTAEQLHVTQPTITRGMQKLESDLGTHLFDRQPNRITLTATGQLAASEAEKLLSANDTAVAKIRDFDRNQRILHIGATIPGPLVALNYLHNQLAANIKVNMSQLPASGIATNLWQGTYTLILSNQPVADTTLDSQYIGSEQLAVNLNKFMIQANQTTITFAELSQLSFVVPNDVGPWRDIIQQAIPTAKFFYQEQRDALSEITKYSDFPYFSTNVSALDLIGLDPNEDDSRVQIPISDKLATMPIYAIYLQTEKQRVITVIKQLTEVWPATFN